MHHERAQIEIEDTGMGIAENELPRIFDRFYRADHARNREIRGSGLGLAIARWIADMHHATIRVQSTLGEGSVFRIELPFTHRESQIELNAKDFRPAPSNAI